MPCIGFGLAMASAAGATQVADEAQRQAAALVARMSEAEKIAQLGHRAPAIPRLGVPAYDWWNEGLHGYARNGYATVFPQAIGLAASWDAPLLHALGDAIATEARAKYNAQGRGDHGGYQGLTIWSPNINIDRDPRWGRGQETYGEDPYLTDRLAVQFVRGLQGDDPGELKAIATPKHFAVHSGPETGRDSFDAEISAHDLEDTYLPAFRAAVVDGRAGSVMCAYNALDGTPACASPLLLQDHLRHAWGFRGYVVSDCDAVADIHAFHHAAPDAATAAAMALKAGTDLDCGDTYDALAEARRRGLVDAAAIDTAARRLFAARYRLGMFRPAADDPYARIGADSVDSAAHRALALRAARESIVLLRNDGTLPLAAGTRLAVVGPDADLLGVLEANYHGVAREPVTPLQGLRARFGADRVHYAQGATLAPGMPVAVPSTALRHGAHGEAAGLLAEVFDHAGFDGAPRLRRTDATVDTDWDGVTPLGEAPHPYAVRWQGALVPPGAGDYVLGVHVERCFDCRAHDAVRLFLDGKPLLADPGSDVADLAAKVHFDDTRPHRLRLELLHGGQDQGVRLQWLAPAAAQLDEAARAAAQADVVVAVVGLSPALEGEALRVEVPGFAGGDRTDLALPAPQQALLERMARSGKPLVVVLAGGGAIVPGAAARQARALLAAWYPGEQGGHALADVLSGDVDPSGRLPVTFYRSVRDLPPFTDYAMRGRTYRYFRGTPLYPFGHGLSYTRFAYAGLRLDATRLRAGAPLGVDVEVSDTGARAGEEVVQAYLQALDADDAPRLALVGFERIALEPGGRRRVHLVIGPRQLSLVDAAGRRAIRPGRYRLFVGGGQPGDAPGQAAEFTIEGSRALQP
ncbi:glycoside hydrolase family 3 C-terminal domain-containing protein [Fulvimonas sp. R45]|uniref:glycoside hydrolase family 3 C-terminal domain-containing protein n=1 Tax=Fulvimonas sp. R45 TaxID=3045937 RepID=UPI00265E7A86|nr:glycoside hydrolase family 3 C-terminal domain-containing protein [Fulvimonas sp. R45]MDO1529561.1 glycoside hydrolase family 3 C-terminal domain-containing protein [Fulvimonas sp. R45]